MQTMQREFSDLKEVMLTQERRERLQGMSLWKRGFAMGWWLLKSLIRKLTPARRLLFVIACFNLSAIQFEIGHKQFNLSPSLGVVIIVFLLMLELKDKLLAHEELQAGNEVQKALMPERSPQVPGWQVWLFTRSANEVGGDLIDFIRINEGRYAVALGDVAGKGLSAALFSAKLQATLKAIAPDFTSLELLGAKLNNIYCRDGLRSLFASLNFIEFQSDSGTIHLLNAGHIPPVLVRTTTVENLQKGGPALGIMPEAVYSEQQEELQDNDVLIVYSDGLTEAQNPSGDFFGEDRLLALLPRMSVLSAEEIGSRLVNEVEFFVGNSKPSDDLSIVILKRKL